MKKYINSFIFGILIAYGLSACADDTGSNAKPVVKENLADKFKSIAEKSVYADMDGDNKEDAVYFLLKSTASISMLSSNTKILQPFYDENVNARADINLGSRHFLYFELSSAEDVVVQDSNKISVLDTEAASSLTAISKKELNGILPENEISSHGDGLVLPTEAGIDLYLFWDGNSIALFEPMDIP